MLFRAEEGAGGVQEESQSADPYSDGQEQSSLYGLTKPVPLCQSSAVLSGCCVSLEALHTALFYSFCNC